MPDPAPERILLDERWREKELGLFFRITHHAVSRRYPEQWALRQEQDVFYYRPPNGESGADVAQRVRAALGDAGREYAGERVLDFNRATNPLCAYSEHYNCPMPPAFNRLEVALKAGARAPQPSH